MLTYIGREAMNDPCMTVRRLHGIANALLARREELRQEALERGLILSIWV